MVSGDDGSFIAVWDIENGKLMSKFGDAHGVIKVFFSYFRNPRLLLGALIALKEGLYPQVLMDQLG